MMEEKEEKEGVVEMEVGDGGMGWNGKGSEKMESCKGKGRRKKEKSWKGRDGVVKLLVKGEREEAKVEQVKEREEGGEKGGKGSVRESGRKGGGGGVGEGGVEGRRVK